jgi:hypothetical protein
LKKAAAASARHPASLPAKLPVRSQTRSAKRKINFLNKQGRQYNIAACFYGIPEIRKALWGAAANLKKSAA